MADWKLEIIKVDNGYLIVIPEENEEGKIVERKIVVEEDEEDELSVHEKMLYEIIEHFGFFGSKHDKERIRIVRETCVGDLLFNGNQYASPIDVELENEEE